MIERSVLIILIVLILDNMVYGISVPFLPIVYEDLGISSSWTGFIIGMFSIAYMIVAPIFGTIVDKFGHKRMIVMGLLFMSASMAAFAAIDYVKDKTQVLIISLFLRSC